MDKLLHGLLLSAFVGLSARRSNNHSGIIAEKVIDPATATVTGTIAPAGAAAYIGIKATDTQTNVSFTTNAGANGVFKFAALKPGNYRITFDLARDYSAPPSLSVVVVAGEIADLGKFSFSDRKGTTLNTGTSAITGSVKPAGAAAMVTAFNLQSNSYYSASVSTSGAFTFNNLPAGPYLISAVAQQGFIPAMNASIGITAEKDKRVNAGPILFYNNSKPSGRYYAGSMSIL